MQANCKICFRVVVPNKGSCRAYCDKQIAKILYAFNTKKGYFVLALSEISNSIRA